MEGIRKIEENDLSQFVSFEKSLFSSSFGIDTLKEEIKKKESYYLGYFEDSSLLGFIYGYFLIDTLEVFNIGVKETFRRRGIGRALMEECFKTPGLKIVNLEVSDKNLAAISFYKALGFVENGKREKYYSDGSDAILMSKEVI